MGFRTEINYILKSSSEEESKNLLNIQPGMSFKVTKSGLRTYVMNVSIMFADSTWNILGMCVITESYVVSNRGSGITEITATVLTRFTPQESVVISKLVLDAETARETLQI